MTQPWPPAARSARHVNPRTHRTIALCGVTALIVTVLIGYFLLRPISVRAADLDGHHIGDPLHEWFNSLSSGKGSCCSIADGVTIKDVDWDSDGQRYRVRIEGKWIVVPDDALVTVPNRYGQAVVWPLRDANGAISIRCFMPGPMT